MIIFYAGKEKVLHTNCTGHFQTDPEGVKLHLTDIVELFRDSFPLKAVLFINSENLDEFDAKIKHLDLELVTLINTYVESAIVATTCWNGEENTKVTASPECNHVPLSIPVNLKIAVTPVK